MSLHVADERLGKRIQMFAIVQYVLLVALLIIGLTLYVNQIPITSYLLVLPVGLLTFALYRLRHHPRAGIMLYLNILGWILGIAALDPLSGFISGATWTLFQIWPPIVTLVLRRGRTAVQVAALTILVMVGQALLIVNQIIPMVIMVPIFVFWYTLALHVLVMAILSTILSLISSAEMRSLQQAQQARAQLQTQLDHVHSLLHEKDQLNVRLARSLDDLRLRGEQLAREQQERSALSRAVQRLAAPVVPVLNGVVVVQMVGSFDPERMERLHTDLLNGIVRESAKVAVLDTTGIDLVDTAVARGLLDLAAAARLLGARVIVVGLRPELAQTIIGLGLDLGALETRADLQDGVRFAMTLVRSS